MMNKEMKDLLRALNAHGVKYLVIGGGTHTEFIWNRELPKTWTYSSAQTKKTVKSSFKPLLPLARRCAG